MDECLILGRCLCRCQHNMVYWSGAPFHAFGLGAASYLQHRRFSRPRSMAAYKAWVAAFQRSGTGVPGNSPLLTPSTLDLLCSLSLVYHFSRAAPLLQNSQQCYPFSHHAVLLCSAWVNAKLFSNAPE